MKNTNWKILLSILVLAVSVYYATNYSKNDKLINSDVETSNIYGLFPENELEACYAKASKDYSNRWMEQCLNLSSDFKCKLPSDIEWSLEGIWASEQDLCDKLYDQSKYQK